MDCSAFHRHHLAYVDDTLPGDLLVAAARHAAECPACARHDTAVRRSLLLARNVCRGGDVECSPDFAARLEARLHAARAEEAGRRGPAAGDDWAPSWWELRSARLTDHLAGHRRTRHALAAAAMLAAVSAGAALRGAPRAEVHALSAGLAAPFGSPFAAASAPALPVFGNAAFAAPASDPGAMPVATESAPVGASGASAGAEAATFVSYDGAVDPGALVAPAATGVPVWAAAMLAGEVPAALWRSAGASSVQLVTDGH